MRELHNKVIEWFIFVADESRIWFNTTAIGVSAKWRASFFQLCHQMLATELASSGTFVAAYEHKIKITRYISTYALAGWLLFKAAVDKLASFAVNLHRLG